MKPSSVLPRAVLAVLLALAAGAPGRGSLAANDAETTRLTPARQLVELPFEPFVGPGAQAGPQEQPAAQVGQSRVAPRRLAPAEPAAQAPSGGGGDTHVTYQNGTNDTDTSSGGSHVTNDADLHTRAGVDTGPDPEP